MSDDFDPYHQWLGISPKHQPPNHYRLLGIELFESHPDVISSAADQRMAHVRSFQSGQRGKISQQVLNELATARLCLLDPEKKQDYDARLREQLTPRNAASPESTAPPPSALAQAKPAVKQPGAPIARPAKPRPAVVQPAEADVTARDLLSDIRAASRLTVLEAERLRLTKFDLPAATQALGEQIYREGRLRSELPEPFAAIDSWKPPAPAGNVADEAAPAGQVAGRQATGNQPAGDVVILLRERAAAMKRGREVDQLFRALGEEGFRQSGEAAGPAGVTGRVHQLSGELARIETEIGELSKRRSGRVFNTRWLALLGCTVIAAVLLLLLRVPLNIVLLLMIVAPIVFAWREFSRSRR